MSNYEIYDISNNANMRVIFSQTRKPLINQTAHLSMKNNEIKIIIDLLLPYFHSTDKFGTIVPVLMKALFLLNAHCFTQSALIESLAITRASNAYLLTRQFELIDEQVLMDRSPCHLLRGLHSLTISRTSQSLAGRIGDWENIWLYRSL